MRAAHVTDATDLRIEYPFVVITPTAKEKFRRWYAPAFSSAW